tara:strand:- start:39 stop:341 length:303 start_codon:yes stop_codon:yes gene_type:complete
MAKYEWFSRGSIPHVLLKYTIMTKERMLIKQDEETGLYKLEVWDKYDNYVGVYEKSIEDCHKYAQSHYDSADKRFASRESWGKCVEQMIKDDRKAGRNWE